MRIPAVSLMTMLHFLRPGDCKTVPILVGDDGWDVFKPSHVDAEAGDVIEFRFTSNKHSVVQGNLATGCYPVEEGGFYSGKQTMPATFRVTINNTDPIAIYSSVDRQCQGGMLAFINANTIQRGAYHITVLKSFINKSPDEPFGGVLASSNNTPDDSNTSSAPASIISQSLVAMASVLCVLVLL